MKTCWAEVVTTCSVSHDTANYAEKSLALIADWLSELMVGHALGYIYQGNEKLHIIIQFKLDAIYSLYELQ